VLQVLDANDNSPQFENSTLELSLKEDIAVGSTVFRVRASDKDSGLNGHVVYSFTQDTVQESGLVFGINGETGHIYTQADLDYETKPEYLLYIVASDRGIHTCGC